MITSLKKTLLFPCLTLIITQAQASFAASFFTPPDAPFIQSAKELTKRIVLPAGLVDQAQKAIDSARAAQPNAFLILEPSGLLVVGANPLRLGSRMNLILSPSAGISAASGATARSLVLIEKSGLVSISSTGPGPAPITGGGIVPVGIQINESGRINLDQLAISGCALTGVALTGRDASVVNEACSLTRSIIFANNAGVKVEQSGAFMCLDNQFKNNKGAALVIKSLCSVVAGNEFSGNQAAIVSGSDRGVITRNLIDDKQALSLTAESAGILVSENRSHSIGQEVIIAGKNQQLFNNSLSGSVRVEPDSGDVFLVGNPALVGSEAVARVTVFNPPTARNPHKNPVIVPGWDRFDLSVPGGAAQVTESVDAVTGKKKTSKKKAVPVDLVTVQTALDQARAAHPKAVLVVKLEGEYISRDPNGLKLPPYTCVMLQGRILADLNVEREPDYVKADPLSQVVSMPVSGVGSISGGTLDCGRQAFFPVNAAGAGLAVIDGVQLTQGARDGVFTRGHGSKAPVFVYHCGIYGNFARGVWSHGATRVHSIDNAVVGNGMDGIDLDAYSKDGTALYNVSSGNRRHGVFLEEAITHHVVFGNNLMGNGFSGVHVWNQEVKGNTGFNVVAANQCTANVRGITVGGREDDITADGNFFFNNVCLQNRSDGFRSGTGRGKNSYFSQCVVGGNVESDINDQESAKATIFNVVPGVGR
jgi:hypothetical protein